MRILFAVFFLVLSAALLLGGLALLVVGSATLLGWELGIGASFLLILWVIDRFAPGVNSLFTRRT